MKIGRVHRFLTLIPVLFILGCFHAHQQGQTLRVGFDVDDTLLFSTPAFEQAFKSRSQPFSPEFWEIVNSSDQQLSVVKKKTLSLLRKHQKNGDLIFIITARHPPGGDKLKEFLEKRFQVAKKNIFFETQGKAERMRQLELDIFYGDSDSDITAALEAGVKPYRIKRASESSYTKKYHPGKFGEEIIENSEW